MLLRAKLKMSKDSYSSNVLADTVTALGLIFVFRQQPDQPSARRQHAAHFCREQYLGGVLTRCTASLRAPQTAAFKSRAEQAVPPSMAGARPCLTPTRSLEPGLIAGMPHKASAEAETARPRTEKPLASGTHVRQVETRDDA